MKEKKDEEQRKEELREHQCEDEGKEGKEERRLVEYEDEGQEEEEKAWARLVLDPNPEPETTMVR